MKVRDIFRTDIDRRIEEVVKVGAEDDQTVIDELDEYVVTRRIEDCLIEVLEAYRATVPAASTAEAIARAGHDRKSVGPAAVWVSGFFGSGKSSFAKVVGHLLENRDLELAGTATQLGRRFLPRCNDLKVPALLEGIWQIAPTITVFLELSSAQDVVNEQEGLVLPVYRALLSRLGYSTNFKLAELEFTLERDARLAEFEAAFLEANQRRWRDSRHNALSMNMAARALHHMDPALFPAADSWASADVLPAMTAVWFASRACEMLALRANGARRLVFVVDEVSQYAALSLDRIRAVQGFAEQINLSGGVLWFIATGQERLDEVVESLENKQTEIARLKARFPITVDLLASDIDEVVSRRVLDKTDAGKDELRRLLDEHRNKLGANLRLISETRSADLLDNDLIRLYPLVPYQIRLLIDAVDKRRQAVRGGSPMGGSNRTIITHAQSLITSARVGLGQADVGALVTLDRSYDLLEEVIPTPWRDAVIQVEEKYGSGTEVAVLKVISLVHDVGALPLTAANLAVLLHPAIGAESRRDEVTAALARLSADDRIIEVNGGYRLLSVEQRGWEDERRAISMAPGEEMRLRKRLIGDALAGLKIASPTPGKTFTVTVPIDGEPALNADLVLEIISSSRPEHQARVEDARADTRDLARAANKLAWVFTPSDHSRQLLEIAHKSQKMIERHDGRAATAEEKLLLQEEKGRVEARRSDAAGSLADDLAVGTLVFRGAPNEVPSGDLRASAVTALRERLPTVFPLLRHFGPDVTDSVLTEILHGDLGRLPAELGDDGAGLFTLTADGGELMPEREPLAGFFRELTKLVDLGACTGQSLERKLAMPPYGAPVGMVKALVAAGIRLGRIEVVQGGQRLTSRTDRRLSEVFGNLPSFRRCELRPAADDGPNPAVRARLAKKLQEATGEKASANLEDLARSTREMSAANEALLTEVSATLRGLGIGVPTGVRRAQEISRMLSGADDALTVSTAESHWDELLHGFKDANAVKALLDGHLDELQRAAAQTRLARPTVAASAADHDLLVDLLHAGDLVGRIGEITELARRLDQVRAEELASRQEPGSPRREDDERSTEAEPGDSDPEPGRVEVVVRDFATNAAGETGYLDDQEDLDRFLTALKAALKAHLDQERQVRLR